MTDPPILRMYDAPEENRYVAELEGGDRAVLDYRIEGERMLFTHTGTPPQHRGRGIASALTEYALSDAVARGMKIAPYCPFTADFVARRRQYGAYLAEGFGIEPPQGSS